MEFELWSLSDGVGVLRSSHLTPLPVLEHTHTPTHISILVRNAILVSCHQADGRPPQGSQHFTTAYQEGIHPPWVSCTLCAGQVQLGELLHFRLLKHFVSCAERYAVVNINLFRIAQGLLDFY